MIKILASLVQMQGLDKVIGEKEVLKKRLPLQLEELERNVAEAKKRVDDAKKALDNNGKSRDTLELEVKSNNEKIEKYESQLPSIKTNKEYKALNSEIDHLKEKNQKIDDKILDLMDEEQALKELYQKAKEGFEGAEGELQDKEADLRKQIVNVDKVIQDTRDERNQIAKTLPLNIVKRYASLINNKNRRAVVFVNNNKGCGGCGFSIRPQLLIDIARKETIVSCESCGRMIVDTSLIEKNVDEVE
ncbi:MAG: C4-type zinc ribbon domain-containing protein [Candidatus Cloacimonas sp.]|nr:C4-type zinc ribbon domain-containing protein [Candidatus Cloacimonadota bacterium]